MVSEDNGHTAHRQVMLNGMRIGFSVTNSNCCIERLYRFVFQADRTLSRVQTIAKIV